MKKSAPSILALCGSILIFSFIAWSFTLHGTIGLYRVNGILQRLFLALGLSGLACCLLALLYRRLEARLQAKGRSRLALLVLALAIPTLVIPTSAFAYVNDAFSSGIGETPPQLIITDGKGAYDIPDLALVFNTKAASNNMLTWGQQGKLNTIEEGQQLKQHVFMLPDLKPDSEYWYQVNSDPDVSFNTPPDNGPLHFAVASDAHFGGSNARNDLTARMLAEISRTTNNFDTFFFLGDLVEHGFTNSHWQQAFTSFSSTTATIPVRFAAGNHDTLFSGFNNYQNYCYPEGMALDTGSRLWYRIDIGQVHFLILDLEWSAESYTSRQAAWLENQLKSIPNDDWKIVMSHGFYYASGLEQYGWHWYDNPETIDRLTPLFEEYGVDLVFSGHNHHLELLQHAGVVYTICGAFGGLPNPERRYISPASLWYISGEYGFLDVTINGNQCSLVFRNADFEVLKEYTFDKIESLSPG